MVYSKSDSLILNGLLLHGAPFFPVLRFKPNHCDLGVSETIDFFSKDFNNGWKF
jgi:hypothetical protein